MIGCKNNNQTQLKKENSNKTNHQEILVAKRVDTILIDGIANEKTWKESHHQDLIQKATDYLSFLNLVY